MKNSIKSLVLISAVSMAFASCEKEALVSNPASSSNASNANVDLNMDWSANAANGISNAYSTTTGPVTDYTLDGYLKVTEIHYTSGVPTLIQTVYDDTAKVSLLVERSEINPNFYKSRFQFIQGQVGVICPELDLFPIVEEADSLQYSMGLFKRKVEAPAMISQTVTLQASSQNLMQDIYLGKVSAQFRIMDGSSLLKTVAIEFMGANK
jgi:hypothetical protein